MFFICGAPIYERIQAGTDCLKSLLKKRGRTEVFALPIGSHGAHRQAQIQFSTLVRTAGAISVRQPPGRLGHRAHRRSIEEERRMQVLVRDNNVDQALKVLKKKMQREGSSAR